MKFVVEPERFKKFLSMVLMCKGNKPLLESTVVEFNEKGALAQDCSLDVVAVYGAFSQKYFLEYSAKDTEKVPLTKTLLEPLGNGFKDEKIEVTADENNIVIKGKTETYNEPLIDAEPSQLPFTMTNTEVGVVPEKLPERAKVQVLLDASELDLPSAEKITFVSDEDKLNVIIKNVGEYTKTFKVKRKLKLEPHKIAFDGSYFATLVGNLDGEVWLTLTDAALALCKKTKDYALTYLLSCLEEA